MNAEEHLEKARINRDQVDKSQLRRARITALVLAMTIAGSLIFFVYAFIQKGVAEKAEQELAQIKLELENCQTNK